jgi:hypothetical protein
MCNLYSIATNQAPIIALFRVINRYVGNLPLMTDTLNAETLILAPGSCAVSPCFVTTSAAGYGCA